MIVSGKKQAEIVKEKRLVQMSDTEELAKIVRSVLDTNPDEVQKYLDGKEQVIGFLVGQVMKATRGQANPKLVNELLKEGLGQLK